MIQTDNFEDNFESNFNWQKQYEPQVKFILKKYFGLTDTDEIVISDEYTDRTKGVDITVIKKQGLFEIVFRLGIRVRSMDKYEAYGNEFTLRYPTEVKKVFNRNIDYELYCFGDNKGNILKYTLISLATFVDVVSKDYKKYIKPCRNQNVDPSGFQAFKFEDFPAHLILDTRTRTKEIEIALQEVRDLKVKNDTKLINTIIKTRDKLAA